MEPFAINLAGQILNIQPRLDGAYDVFERSELVGVVKPMSANEETRWTSEELNVDYARQIGELIDEHQL